MNTQTRLVNLTSHPIIYEKDGVLITLPPERNPVRVDFRWKYDNTIEGYDIVESNHNIIENVPFPEEGCIFIVSTLAGMLLRRKDIISPDTGPTAIRERGKVVAIRRFQRYT